MSTALDLIKRSMRLLRVLGEGDPDPSDAEAQDGLEALNSMLDAWALERLMVYQTRQENFTWPATTTSRTIGSGGNFNTTRPIKIENGFVRSSGYDYAFSVIGREAYDALPLKSSTGTYPEYLFYDPGFSLGTIYLYGVPASSVSLYINSRLQFTQAASLNTTVSLPPGYKRAIEYNLAVEFAPEFNQAVPPEVSRIAIESKRSIKNVNAKPIVSQIDSGIVGGRRSSILTG